MSLDRPKISPDKVETDAELVERMQSGHQSDEAFGELYCRYSERIYHFIIVMTRHPEDAAEITQETFFRAWIKLSMLKDGSLVSSWLFSIARNLALNSLRKREKSIKYEEYLTQNVIDTKRSSQNLEACVEQKELLELVLNQLPYYQRTCLLLRVKGHSIPEIADLLGKNVSSVETYISQARQYSRKSFYQLANEQELEPKKSSNDVQRFSSSYRQDCANDQANKPLEGTESDIVKNEEVSSLEGSQISKDLLESSDPIDKLPNIYRQKIYLRLIKQYSLQQVAAQFGLPLGTVKSQISRGMLLLRRIVEGEDIGKKHAIEESNFIISLETGENIKKVPECYRQVLHLKFVERHSDRQIAMQLGWPLGTVKSQISRGKKLLLALENCRPEKG